MIYFLYGENTDKARVKAHELIDTLLKKKPDASLFKVESQSFEAGHLDELTGGQGLFEKKYIIFFDRLFEKKDVKEAVLEKLKEISESPNIFIFLEGKTDKATLTRIEKKAEKIQEFASENASGKGRQFGMGPGTKTLNLSEFNIFALGDALGNRDKKNLWLTYQKAVMRETPAEEIHGILFWALKSMMLATTAKTAEEAGLNPFVFQKSKRFAENYSPKELADISDQFVRMYHDAHRGLVDFDIALEKFILA